MLGGGEVKTIWRMWREGTSIRTIADRLGMSRNTVRRYLRHPGIPEPQPRPRRPSKLDPFRDYLLQRVRVDGVTNSEVLLRELRKRGYTGGRSILKEFLKPLRPPRAPKTTVRFETEPGEQAQVDFKIVTLVRLDGQLQRLWAFCMVLSWSRAMFLEFIAKATLPLFIRCHLHAFAHFGGVPRRCLYDNTKQVVLGRDAQGEPLWNARFLDFALRVGFDPQLCRPYRAQTKGKVERGLRYVGENFIPWVRPTDVEDLNRQALSWCVQVADPRIHGTTHERPADRLRIERPCLGPLPALESLAEFLREERKVGRDGFVLWERCAYGVPWTFAGQTVQVEAKDDRVEIWAGSQRLAVHPRGQAPGQRFVLPGQWAGLPSGSPARRQPAVIHQVPAGHVEIRPLSACAALLEEGVSHGRP